MQIDERSFLALASLARVVHEQVSEVGAHRRCYDRQRDMLACCEA